jgi:hypothetical protein
MAKEKYTHRLPQPRVSEDLFNLVHQVSEKQEVGVADVIRLALEDYCSPPAEVFNVPIIGEIQDNHVVFYPYVKIEGVSVKTMLDNSARELKEQWEKGRSRYLEVEPVGGVG